MNINFEILASYVVDPGFSIYHLLLTFKFISKCLLKKNIPSALTKCYFFYQQENIRCLKTILISVEHDNIL